MEQILFVRIIQLDKIQLDNHHFPCPPSPLLGCHAPDMVVKGENCGEERLIAAAAAAADSGAAEPRRRRGRRRGGRGGRDRRPSRTVNCDVEAPRVVLICHHFHVLGRTLFALQLLRTPILLFL